jgi:hypothetical protein
MQAVPRSSFAGYKVLFVPRVLRFQRAEHKLMAAQEGLPGYKAKSLPPAGKPKRAECRGRPTPHLVGILPIDRAIG